MTGPDAPACPSTEPSPPCTGLDLHWRTLERYRQFKGKHGAAALTGGGRERSAVPPGQVPGDGQAEAGSSVVAAAGVVEPYAPLGTPLALLLRHAVAVVGDLKHSPAIAGGPHGHDHFRRGVPLRIVDQIRQDP